MVTNLDSLKTEERLVLLLVKPTWTETETTQVMDLVNSHMDWSRVLGLLQYHRVTGMVWSNIQKYLKKLDVQLSYEKLFSNVSQSYNLQLNKAKEQWEHTKRVCQKFDENGINYALLKGIALSACVYKDWGARNFGDTDILIHPSQINLATQCLKDVGYIQGVINLDRSDIVAASRKDTMFWSLVSHEVHPFIIKTPNSLIIHSHEVDLQFSIDLNTANRTDVSVTNLLDNSISVNIDNTRIKTLNWEDFLIFLCIHYYKEATTIRDVKAYNDLTLYKLCDIFYLLVHKEICIDWNKFHESVEATQSHKGVYYALSNLNSLYIDVVSDDILIRLKPQDLSYLDEVYHYNSNEIAGRWDMSFAERFFDPNRIIKLNEEIAMSNRS